MIAIRARQVFDGERIMPTAETVLVEGGCIVDVQSRAMPLPQGCELVAFPDATLLPGLIDTHVHLCGDGGLGVCQLRGHSRRPANGPASIVRDDTKHPVGERSEGPFHIWARSFLDLTRIPSRTAQSWHILVPTGADLIPTVGLWTRRGNGTTLAWTNSRNCEFVTGVSSMRNSSIARPPSPDIEIT